MSSKITVVKEVDYRVIEVISAGPQGASGNTGQGSGTVTGVSGGTALTVTGDANVDPTVNHDAFGTASTYAFPSSITTNSTGHITAAAPGQQPLLANNNLSDVNANTARTNLGVPGTNHSHAAGNIISGEFNVDRIPALPAAKITSGVLSTARIPTLSTGSISGLGTSATVDVPSSGNAASGEVVKGSDTRLSDARTPVTGWAGSGSITQVGTISSGTWNGTAISYAALSGKPTLGTAAAAATGDFSPVAGSASITTVGTITSGTWSGTAIGYGSLSGKPSLGTASQYNAGIGSNSILQANANVADDDFLRVAGTKVEGRTAAEVLTDIGAQASLTAPVTSPAMTGVSAASITGVIKCSQSQYDAITPDANTLYVIV